MDPSQEHIHSIEEERFIQSVPSGKLNAFQKKVIGFDSMPYVTDMSSCTFQQDIPPYLIHQAPHLFITNDWVNVERLEMFLSEEDNLEVKKLTTDGKS